MRENDQRTAPPSALESAACFLRGCLSADGGAHECCSRREQIDWQFDRLYEWAKAESRIGESQILRHTRPGGREHRVLHDPQRGRFWKFTEPLKAGVTFTVAKTAGRLVTTIEDATPVEYLERLIAHNEIFGDDIELECLVLQRGRACIATSQSFIQGSMPSEQEIESMMLDMGFVKSPNGAAYFRKKDQIAVWDAHPGNFLKSDGVVVPIDLICLPASALMIEALDV